ncbi:MAG: polysaccharide deacetylase family protein [Anaerolineales bacterium]
MKKGLLKAAYSSQVWNFFHPLGKNRLMVLNYHRINDPYSDNFSDFVPNVSATPKLFASQMDYLLSRGFNFISQGDLIAWLDNRIPLPPYAVLVTFDDGYADNYSNAFPILKQRNIPATIFLSVDHIGTSKPFYWDLVSYCLYQSPFKEKNLPLLGIRSWEEKDQWVKVADDFVRELKGLPENEKKELLFTIPDILEVKVKNADFEGKHLNWDQVKEMSKGLITFGGHTRSHPILTQINIKKVLDEVMGSKIKIEKELGYPVESMAYPNGGERDFSPEIMAVVEKAGYKIAFSLIDGYTQYRNLNQMRFQLRRIYLGRNDLLPRFAAKVNPITMWIK